MCRELALFRNKYKHYQGCAARERLRRAQEISEIFLIEHAESQINISAALRRRTVRRIVECSQQIQTFDSEIVGYFILFYFIKNIHVLNLIFIKYFHIFI